jgi:hypothetical protein
MLTHYMIRNNTILQNRQTTLYLCGLPQLNTCTTMVSHLFQRDFIVIGKEVVQEIWQMAYLHALLVNAFVLISVSII